LPRNKNNPPCPACGSSATLPFENEENASNEETFSEIILTIFLLFLVLFCLFLILLLSHAGLPIALLILLVILLYWRRKKASRHNRPRSQQFICLDCSRNFKA
jgi:Flp pilus assembly protein TadB